MHVTADALDYEWFWLGNPPSITVPANATSAEIRVAVQGLRDNDTTEGDETFEVHGRADGLAPGREHRYSGENEKGNLLCTPPSDGVQKRSFRLRFRLREGTGK